MKTVLTEPFGDAPVQDPMTGMWKMVERFVIAEDGIEVHLLSYGAGICGVVVPDRDGKRENIVLGFDQLDGYQQFNYHGSTIGRCANRIKEGKFSLNNQDYQLTLNNNGNHLHGGTNGWNRRVWSASVLPGSSSVSFELHSRDGDEGYPGNVTAKVVYTLDKGRLDIKFSAYTDQDTPINMTNHAFFNLAGHDAGSAELSKHLVQLDCDKYLPTNDLLIPTGEQRPVENTVFDLRSPRELGSVLHSVEGGGYDHCYVLENSQRAQLKCAAKFEHPGSGRYLEVFTTEPSVQFYTANFLPDKDGGMVGRGGVSYRRHGAFCCEPQNFPDAINQSNFPAVITRAGQSYHHEMVYQFGAK